MTSFALGEENVVSDARVLRRNSNSRNVIDVSRHIINVSHKIINVCMSSDESHLIGLVTAVNSIYRNSRHPIKFHILVTAAAYAVLVSVSFILILTVLAKAYSSTEGMRLWF